MTNYTKTTDFAAKDALPSGNAAKIVKGSEIDAEFDNIATSSATKANANAAALTGTTTFETISDGTIAITAFVDEDNMASDSATLLPTQQSVKAYVDSQVTAQDLDFQADTGGALSIDLDSETLTLTGGTGIDTSGALNAVTFAIDATVATLAGTQTLSNKTLSAPVVSGNLTTDGLVDGRDVAADGTKLDGIEALADVTDTANVTAAGALMDSELTDIAAVKALDQGVATTDSPTFAGLTTTADVSFGDNDKAIFGAGSDLQIYHDGSDSYVDDAGVGDLVLRGNNQVLIRDTGTNEVMGNFRSSGAVTLYYDNAEKISTTSTGIDVTGVITTDGMTTSADINFGDNDKAIFGAGDDLQIYHDGTRSYISDSGTGDLRLRASEVRMVNAANTEVGFKFVEDGAASLYFNANEKLATTSTGIDVTGSVVSDGVTVAGNILLETEGNELQFNTSSTPVNKIYTDDTYTSNGLTISADNGVAVKSANNYLLLDDTGTNEMVLNVDSGERMRVTSAGIDVTGTVTADGLNLDGNIQGDTGQNMQVSAGVGSGDKLDLRAGDDVRIYVNGASAHKLAANFSNNGDISFYNSAGTSQSLFWDSSAESLGIGTSSPNYNLTSYKAGANANYLQVANGSTGVNSANGTLFGVDASGNGIVNVQGAFDYITSVAGTERLRIDSSGNLLVGTTNIAPYATSTTTGLVYRADFGLIGVSRNSNYSGSFNRYGTDGDILNFRKDGTTVGSIGVASNDLNINGGANHSGIRFQATGLYPLENGSASSGEIDLGAAGSKFKNLYLSGGAYLGGTGSANKLDDYEEGTWTPDLSFAGVTTGITYGSREGAYTKVGRLVTAFLRVTLSSNGTATTGQCYISLPFTVGNVLGTTSVQGSSIVGFMSNFTGSHYGVEAMPFEGNDHLRLYQRTSVSGDANVFVTPSNIENSFDCRITVQFMTS